MEVRSRFPHSGRSLLLQTHEAGRLFRLKLADSHVLTKHNWPDLDSAMIKTEKSLKFSMILGMIAKISTKPPRQSPKQEDDALECGVLCKKRKGTPIRER